MALHHHCCHHHSSTSYCTHHHPLKSSNNIFRPGAGSGVWLPALLPAACVAGSLTDASSSQHISQPLTLLAIQSCVYCFLLVQQQMFHKIPIQAAKEKTLACKITPSPRLSLSTSSARPSSQSSLVMPHSRQTTLISPSSTRDVTPGPPRAQKWSSPIDRFVDAIAALWTSNARLLHLRQDPPESKLMSQNALFLHMITIVMICYFSEAGLFAAAVASLANLSVQAAVLRWLMRLHSSTFSPGEWLMAGQCAGVSVSCSLLSLLSACPREAAYSSCQLNTFLQLSVVLSAGLLLLFLALPASHSSSPFILVPLTLAVGGAGVLWASIMLGEFVPWWLTRQMLAGDVDWSGPLTNTTGCGGGGGYSSSGRAEAAWWFGNDGADNTSGAGLKTWWGGGRNSWSAYLLGGGTSSGGMLRWWRAGKESWLSYFIGGGFLWGGSGGAATEGSGGAVMVVGWRRPLLLLWWAMCSVAAWGATRWVQRYQHVSVSVMRKLYHLVAVLVFVAGVLADPPFLKLATVAATIACLILEVVRVQKVPGVSSLLTNAFSSFLDEKDSQGTLILSHIYLLVGFSLPLWIPNVPGLNLPPICSPIYHSTVSVFTPANSDSVGSPLQQPQLLGGVNSGSHRGSGSNEDVVCWCGPGVSAMLVLSGVLAVGIGDTFASVGGIRFGKHKWPRSKKTMEGTVIAVVAQLLVVAVLVLAGGVIVTSGGCVWWTGVAVTMVVCGVVEALTDQVDNLVLPLLMFCGISITEYITS